MKKIWSAVTVVLLTAVSAGVIVYGSSVSDRKIDTSGKQTYAWPLATCSTEDTITHVFAQTFAEEVERLSGGEMEIQVYPQSTLGGDRELMESCKDGDIPFVIQTPAPQVSFMPELCVFDTPCVFDDIEEARAAIDDPEFFSVIQGIYEDAGYQILGLADQCFRVMTSSEPFTGMESFKGQKIRTMENTYHIQFWNAVGASPTPMTFSEVYIGLQQGTIDAQENAYELIVSAKLYEQQEVLVQTNAVPDYITLIVSDDFFRDLDKEQQQIVREAAAIAQEKARESADERREQREEELAAEGMEIVEIDQQTWEEMQEACQPVYENIRKQAGDELVDLYMGVE